jgi:hypothetical protein
MVTVVGSNFRDSAILQASFGGQVIRLAFATSSAATCVAPAHASVGNVSVAVSNNGVDFSATAATVEVLTGDVRIKSLLPSQGAAAGGYAVTVMGAGFTNEVLNVMFGDGTVACDVLTGNVAECHLERTPAGDVTVVSDGAEGVLSFAFLDAVTITSIIPSNGPSSGHTILAVTGSGFGASHTESCRFGSHASTPASVSSSSLLRCHTPSHSPGTVSVTIPSVSTSDGDAVSSAAFRFQEVLLTGVTPAFAFAGAATDITIHGTPHSPHFD